MPTHTFYYSHTSGGGSLSGQIAVENDTELNADLVLAAEASAIVLSLAFTVANCQALALSCTGDCSVEFYETATLKDTIALTANVPKFYPSQALVDGALTATAPTSLKLSSTSGGTFSFRAILSQNTPA